jgi:hypothetical protein
MMEQRHNWYVNVQQRIAMYNVPLGAVKQTK